MPEDLPNDDADSTSANLLNGVPMHMYPFPQSLLPAQISPRSKRRQVKNACTNCQKACKKCDDARPCMRCVKYGISEECVDSRRKERKKGAKRGPYKKRDSKDRAGSAAEQFDILPQHMESDHGMVPLPISVPNGALRHPNGEPSGVQYLTPTTYAPLGGYFSQPPYLPPHQPPKPGELFPAAAYFPQYYLPPTASGGPRDVHGLHTTYQPVYVSYAPSYPLSSSDGHPLPYQSYYPRHNGGHNGHNSAE